MLTVRNRSLKLPSCHPTAVGLVCAYQSVRRVVGDPAHDSKQGTFPVCSDWTYLYSSIREIEVWCTGVVMLREISVFIAAVIISTRKLCSSRFPRLKTPCPRICTSMMGRTPSGKGFKYWLEVRQKEYMNQSAVFQKPGTQSNHQLLDELWLLSMCVVLAHGK